MTCWWRKKTNQTRKMKNRNQSLRNAVAEAMGSMGIPGVEFADEHGRVVGRIKSKMPPDVSYDVPAYGGGTVSVKKGDRVRCWCRDEETGEWFVEGKRHRREAVGTVLALTKEGSGCFCLAYQRDKSDWNEGPSSCTLRNDAGGWARVVEKLGDGGDS